MSKFTTSVSDNKSYPVICEQAANDDFLFSKFKQNPYYNMILEHTSYEYGKTYLQYIVDLIGEKDALEFIEAAAVNDKFGGSTPISYLVGDQRINVSPSTLRYAKIGIEIVNLFGDISKMNICEIGGGYGGQATVLWNTHGFKRWDILDIKEANLLQRKYITNVGCENVNCFNLSEHKDKLLKEYDIVISNFAFSELKRDIQNDYMDLVIKHSKNGYMIMNYCWDNSYQGKNWVEDNGFQNMMTEDDIRIQIPSLKTADEFPKTHPKNILFYWGNNANEKR